MVLSSTSVVFEGKDAESCSQNKDRFCLNFMTWPEVKDQDIKLIPEVCYLVGSLVVGVKAAAYISTRRITHVEAMYIR